MFHDTQGKTTKQAHKAIPEGHFEEEQGRKGFFGKVSHLIRSKPSTRWSNIEGPLKPRLFDIVEMSQAEGQQRLLYNNQITILNRWVEVKKPEELAGERNADGENIFFCHKGCGEFYSEYGVLKYEAGHYIVMPKCIAYAIAPKEKSNFLVIESRTDEYTEPARGMLGRHAVYDTNSFGRPDLERQQSLLSDLGIKIDRITVKHNDELTKFSYEDCLFADIVGWKGDLFPFTLHVDDLMPIMSHRSHLPPSAHSTFVGGDFIVCTFVPRPLEEDADALKVPFYHQNIDYDEVIFYHDGNFFSRDNLHPGMITLHPAGFPHGPHPKAVEGIEARKRTDEYAVMIDTRWPLKRDKNLDTVEKKDYWKSWRS